MNRAGSTGLTSSHARRRAAADHDGPRPVHTSAGARVQRRADKGSAVAELPDFARLKLCRFPRGSAFPCAETIRVFAEKGLAPCAYRDSISMKARMRVSIWPGRRPDLERSFERDARDALLLEVGRHDLAVDAGEGAADIAVEQDALCLERRDGLLDPREIAHRRAEAGAPGDDVLRGGFERRQVLAVVAGPFVRRVPGGDRPAGIVDRLVDAELLAATARPRQPHQLRRGPADITSADSSSSSKRIEHRPRIAPACRNSGRCRSGDTSSQGCGCRAGCRRAAAGSSDLAE